MNDVARAECERVWNEAREHFNTGVNLTFTAGDKLEGFAEALHAGNSAAIAIIIAAKRKWENAKLDEAAEAIRYWETAWGDASSVIERLKQE